MKEGSSYRQASKALTYPISLSTSIQIYNNNLILQFLNLY